MALCRKIYHCVELILRKTTFNKLLITNIALDESKII